MNAPITQMNSELLREMRKAQIKKSVLDGLRVLAIVALDQINKRRPLHEGSDELAARWAAWAEKVEPLMPEDFGDVTPEQALKDSLDWLLEPTCEAVVSQAAEYEQVLADHRRLVRELDVLLNGEGGAAHQDSLADVVSQLIKYKQA